MGRLKHLQQGFTSFGHLPNTNVLRNATAYGVEKLENWWVASIGVNTSTDLAAISYWDDIISGIRWLQGTAAAQPRLKLSSSMNASYPSIDFHTNARGMQSTYGILPMNKTIAAVCKVNTINTANGLLGSSFAGIQSPTLAGNAVSVSGIGVYNGGNNTPAVATTIEDTNSHIVVFTPNGVIVDGVTGATGSTNMRGRLNRLGSAGTFNSGTTIIGEIGELLVFNKNLSNDEGVTLCNQINAKWAIY